jgi:hypothetical protein
MSEPNHYAKLGVGEDASFEEIQQAKERSLKECGGDRKQMDAIEAAYDAILMDRLRLRQQGKIKVPERIRFPEKAVEPPPEFTPSSPPQTPDWLRRMVDTPSRNDILLPGGVFLGLALLSTVGYAAVALALGVGFNLYFLNRKERRFGRSLLLTVAGLVIGVIVGVQFGNLLSDLLASLSMTSDAFAAIFTFIVLWLISSFLR